jgi:hypothetical protein
MRYLIMRVADASRSWYEEEYSTDDLQSLPEKIQLVVHMLNAAVTERSSMSCDSRIDGVGFRRTFTSYPDCAFYYPVDEWFVDKEQAANDKANNDGCNQSG